MTAMEKRGLQPVLRLAAPRVSPEAEIVALRGALRLETRLAEALACRSRALIELVEILSRRALSEAGDIADARLRLDRLAEGMRKALDSGETARPGDLATLAERSLGVFEMGEGPRIAIDGPRAVLSEDAARLVGLTLFELASRSLRHGALALAEGRAALDWALRADGALRVTWREYGAPARSDELRGGAGGALQPLLSDRFGAPLRVRATPFGLRAELTVPACDLRPAASDRDPAAGAPTLIAPPPVAT